MEGTEQRATTIQMTIQLQDENDNAPVFTSTLFDATVPENGGPGSSVARVFVSDPDASGSHILSLKGPDAAGFDIKQNGVIEARQSLDYETKHFYEFEVHAMDLRFESFSKVQIKVRDINDHRPAFAESFYSFDLPEDAPKGYTVGKVKAEDLDSGRNGHVIYELRTDWGREFFQINHFLGELTLIQEVDFEERQLYTLTVIARDEGLPAKSSEVVVYMNVKDINDNQPEFDPMTYSREISEDATPGTLVVNVSATDVDSGLNGEIRYSVLEEGSGYFAIGPINGSVYTTSPLDRELHPVYSLVVLATDQASDALDRLSTMTTVSVHLKDVNDQQPEFTSPSHIGIREDATLGSTVFTVQADDLDIGINGKITFTLVSVTTSSQMFSLDSESGALILERALDRESVESYSLVIEARDGGLPAPLSSRQTLDVTVLDANDNAPDFTKDTYEKTVAEDVSVGTSLMRVLAQDDDEGSNGAVRYFIVGGTGRHDFHLDMSSGVLRVQKSLDYERTKSYTLVVQAEDSSVENPLHSNATVVITVTDVNDFVPAFDNSPYHTFVQEGLVSGKGQPIFNITARDEDSGENGLVQYALRNIINYSDLFEIHPLTGEVMMLKPLDRETTPMYVLTIIAIDNGMPTQTGSTTLTVFVKDVNDHSPVFESSDPYLGHVMENKPEGTPVIQVAATDRDEGANSRIVYTLEDNEEDHFRIEPHSGVIETTGPLDRELESQYLLTVVATDQGIPPRSARIKVKVVVSDDNDHAPDFSTKKYSVTIHGSRTADFLIGVTAVDRDVGNNGKVVYSLEGSTNFHINSETGVITLATTPKPTRTFTFVVRASDLGNVPLNSTATVTVQVLATSPVSRPIFNDFPPKLKIKENSWQGTLLTTVRATSSTSSRVSYHIAGGNVNNAFVINSNNGSILVSSKIDYEVTNRFQLWIEARDQRAESMSAFQELTVDVEDENDNNPTFSHAVYPKDFLENAELNSKVFKVTASDLDSGKNQQLVYQIKQGNTNNTFSINPSTGMIHTANVVVDREKIPFYNLVVEASDMGTPQRSASATVRITILDDNDNQPTFTGSRSVAVPEDLPVNSLVMQLTIRDKDIGKNAEATFSMDAGNGDELPFALDAASGNITNIRKLDAEMLQRYRPTVSVTDGKFLVRTTLTIRLLDVNDNAPKFKSSVLPFHFRELQAAAATVGQLTALDLDISSPNNQFFFSLKRPSSLFELDAETGVIIALDSFHFFGGKSGMESMNEHVLEAVVTDLGIPSLSSEATIVVHITDSNDHSPSFVRDKYFSAVPVTLSSVETILQVEAVDNEDYGVNAEIGYSIVDGTGFDFFSINSTSGKINPKRSLAGRENQKLYITVQATDKGLPPKSATVTVELEITPDNTQSPRFGSDPFSAKVREDAAKGHLIATITATDSDSGLNGEVLYSITAGNDLNSFDIGEKDGKLRVKGSLDYETHKVHTITITARDRGLFYKFISKKFTIVLEDVNDNAPEFEYPYYDAYMQENSAPFSPVFKVSAFDVDTEPGNKEILYSIKGAKDSEEFFTISETTGEISSSSKRFDYEKRSLYTLLVMAYNTGDTSSSDVKKSLTTVYIHVTGANEFIPQFVKHDYTFQISESAEKGVSVGSVSALDKDKGPDGVVYYYLEGQSNLQGFMIEALTGIIRVDTTADYESSHYIVLKVLAKNWGSVTGNDTDLCTVNITILDANDPPEFSKERYIARIKENIEGIQKVTQVHAEDKDTQPSNRKFTYLILRGNEQSKFRITQNGIIETKGLGRLDREITPVFELIVGAQDSGDPPRLGSATVEVHLDDVNDNGPQFDPIDLTVHVSENETAGVLVTILSEHTTDLDLAGNQGPYTYQMLDSAASKYFRILADSGRVETKQRLNREESPKFLVPVMVSDSGRPVQSSTLTFTIVVEDVNNSPPKPRPLTLVINILEKGQIKGKVADVSPLDSDLTGKYTCSIKRGDAVNFLISKGCDLEVAGDLLPQAYTLTIRAWDDKFEPVEYDVTILVDSVSNETLQNSLSLKLKNTRATKFLESGKYSLFQKTVGDGFGASFSCKVFGMKEVDDDVYVMLYVEESNQQVLGQADLIRGLSKSISNIKTTTGIDIDSFCSSNPCSNDGVCYTAMSLASGTLISSSSSFILTSSNVAIVPLCVCKNPFTGPLCNERQERCGTDYCQNGGTCLDGKCECTSDWRGEFCREDVDECAAEIPICINDGSCRNLPGSFECQCPQGYHGRLCELQNYCANQPCSEYGTCIERGNTYECQCDYGYHGQRCQFSSMSFGEESYAEFRSVDNYGTFNASLYVATVQENALLVFSPIRIGQNSHGFVAVEVVNGRVQVSFRLSASQGRNGLVSLATNNVINTGKWHRLEFMKNTQTATLVVQECEHSSCKLCDRGRGCYKEVPVPLPDQQLQGKQLSLGGVRDFSDIQDQRGEVTTFNLVGCMHSVVINSKTYAVNRLDLVDNAALRAHSVSLECPRHTASSPCQGGKVCHNGGTCVDEWSKASCQCVGDYTGPSCQTERQPFSLGANGVVKLTLKQSYVRQTKLYQLTAPSAGNSGRRRRAVADSSVLIRFRTTKRSGMLYSSRTATTSCFLWYSDDQVHFLLKTKDAVNDPLILTKLTIADGKWHNVTVLSQDTRYTLDFDGGKASELQDFGVVYDFDSLDIQEMAISGKKTLPDNSVMEGLDGCLSKVLVNGNTLPLDGSSSSKYSVEVAGSVEGECRALCDNQCKDNKCVPKGEAFLCHYMAKEAEGLETGIIIVIVFLIIFILVAVVLFILFKTRRDYFHKCIKTKKENRSSPLGSEANGGKGGMSNSDSVGGGTNGGIPRYLTGPTEEEIINNHIIEELTGQKTNSLTARPDLIGSSYSPQMLSDGVMIIDPDDLQGVMMDEEGAPEHYDFENASSIAPSDIAPSDMIRHYRDFRNGKQPHHHQHHQHHHHQKQQPPLPQIPNKAGGGGNSHLFNKYRDSPTSMSGFSNYRSSPHNHQQQFPRQSPISLTGSALSVPAHSSPHMAPNVNGGRPSSAQAAISHPTSRSRSSPLTQLHVRSPRTHPHGSHTSYSGNNSSTNYSSNNNLQVDGRGSRSDSIGSHHSHSSSSSATTVPTGFPHPNHHPSNHKPGKSRNPKGLTVEDVNRLNARPDMLLHDPTMSSVHRGKGKGDKPPHHQQHIPPPYPVIEGSLLLEPPDSSSDDSGANDSFTCSEFEYENEATRTRLDLDPSKMIFSKLTEVDNECDEMVAPVGANANQNYGLQTDGLNSNGDSFASTNASSSNSPSSPVSQPVSSQYDFDALLNWGPNFDKLVGVFSDIAQLPDSGHAVEGGDLDHTYEEYV